MKKKILYNMAGIYELQHMDKNADREFTGYVVAKDMLTKEETKISCTIVADELLKGRVVDGGEKPKVKRIYIVHTDALSEDDDRRFEDIPDEEIIDMYDLYRRYFWALNNKKFSPNTRVGNIDEYNVWERLRALQWVLTDIKDWYDIKLHL